jgi:cell division protein FtsZ
MDEIGQITDYIQSAAGENADLIWGNGTDANLGENLNVTIIATGFCTNSIPELYNRKRQVDIIPLDGQKSTNREIEQSIFTIKDKPAAAPPKRDKGEPDQKQRVIEFPIHKPASDPKTNAPAADATEFVVKTANPQTAPTQKEHRPKILDGSPTVLSSIASIDHLEKEPAYKRKNIKLEDTTYSEKPNVSRFTLKQEDGDIFLKNDNAYLHDNVD